MHCVSYLRFCTGGPETVLQCLEKVSIPLEIFHILSCYNQKLNNKSIDGAALQLIKTNKVLSDSYKVLCVQYNGL